jgi:hypothetical protein
MYELDTSALGSDAQKWAKAFLDTIVDKSIEIDEGLMISWFANSIETAKNGQTFVQAVDHAVHRAQFHRTIHVVERESGGREFSTAITKLEEAAMWFTRGMAKVQGKFNPADLEEDNGFYSNRHR